MKSSVCARSYVTFLRTVGAMLTLAGLVLVTAATTVAQITVFVPGNASGHFGNPADQSVPLVPALTVNGPGTITVTYTSGLVTWSSDGSTTGPEGASCSSCQAGQTPLHESRGEGHRKLDKVGALIGIFVPAWRVQQTGFQAIDGTKGIPTSGPLVLGICPADLLFVGESKTFDVTEAGTLFLGINDPQVGDNSGGFNVTVTGP